MKHVVCGWTNGDPPPKKKKEKRKKKGNILESERFGEIPGDR